MYVDVSAANWRSVYKLCIGFINPRPIALVSTVSSEGQPNLAPFSFYNMVSGNPPVVMFCPARTRHAAEKDTLRNVRQTREFAIATVTEPMAEKMVACGADLPPDRSEFDFSGLTARPATRIRPALVAEAPVNIECTLRDILSFGEHPSAGNVVFGDIIAIHIDDAVLDEAGRIDPKRLPTVGRLGGAGYCTVREPYELHIPDPPG